MHNVDTVYGRVNMQVNLNNLIHKRNLFHVNNYNSIILHNSTKCLKFSFLPYRTKYSRYAFQAIEQSDIEPINVT